MSRCRALVELVATPPRVARGRLHAPGFLPSALTLAGAVEEVETAGAIVQVGWSQLVPQPPASFS
ncbi:MAG: hypothetical protein M3292_07685 [Actinomycetota bacterium]|nr:hypothetical protein [Actinomycetota bacterium]